VTWKNGETIKIYSVGRTEKYKLISAIIPEGYKLHQTVFKTGLDKYIGIACSLQKRL